MPFHVSNAEKPHPASGMRLRNDQAASLTIADFESSTGHRL
jgi:hypothetical protein